MSPMPLSIAQALAHEHQRDLRATGPGTARRAPRRVRLRRWAKGWIDRSVVGTR